MQRIMNNPDDIVDEMLAGFVKCHSDIVKLVKTGEENPRGVVAAVDAPIADKVGIVTGGGSGHKPAFIGYVGKNMCDAAAVGETCPPRQRWLSWRLSAPLTAAGVSPACTETTPATT